MSSYWINFVRAGDPNGDGLPTWASFRAGLVMKLDTPSSGGPEDGRERQTFLQQATAQRRS